MNLKKINKNNSSWKTSLFLLTFFCLLIPFFSSHADVNKQINYQGKLTDETNSPVPDGSYNMIFKLYDADTSGTLLWTGTHTTANSNPVTVTSGIFSVLLGSGTGNTLNLDFNSNSYYLQVEIYNSDTTAWETLSPRKQLGSTPSSFNSDRLDGLDSAESGANAHIIKTDSSGNLTISGNTYFNGTTYYVNSSGVANLNGLNLPNLTQGSIPFIGATGTISQDNSNFFWDNTNQRLGIGTTTPDANLSISSASGSQFINLHDSTNSDSVGIYSGSGSPEGTVSAQIGSIYSDNASGRIYKKSSGDNTNIGWEEFTNTSSTAHMAKMTRDVAQNIPTSVYTKILFDNEEFDVGNIADTSTGRFTINKTGKYAVFGQIPRWNTLMGSSTVEVIAIYKNGIDIEEVAHKSSLATSANSLQINTVLDLSVDDYIELYVHQDDGVTNTTSDNSLWKPRMSVVQLDDANGGESLFTDSGDSTYLTSTTDDLILGSTTNTNAPFYLDVSTNSLRLGSGATTDASLNLYSSGGDTGSLSYTNDSFLFSGGTVGIGTTNSVVPLSVLNTTTYGVASFNNSNPNGYGVLINTNGTRTSEYALKVTSNNYATTGLYVRNDGNVGIGNQNPVSLFSVGDLSQFQINGLGNVLGGTYNGLTMTSAVDGFTISGGTTSRTLTVNGANITLDQNLATTSSPTFSTINTGQGANELYAMNQDVLTTSSLTFAGLSLNGNLALNTAQSLSMENGKHWITYNDGKGNFNIRVAHDPAELITEDGYAFHQEYLQSTGALQFNISQSGVTGDAAIWNDTLQFSTGGILTIGNAVRVAKSGDSYFNGGYVGIGTASPSQKLEVVGTAKVSSLEIDNWLTLGQEPNEIIINTFGSAQIQIPDNTTIINTGWGDTFFGFDGANLIVNVGDDLYSDTSLNVFGEIIGKKYITANSATGGLVTRVSAGAPINAANNGNLVVDSTNGRMYFRYSNAWHYVNQTGGFQIPNYEVAPSNQLTQAGEEASDNALSFESSNFPSYLTEKITPGELLIPYVDEYMQDGAAHGLYARFADVRDMMFQETDTKILTLEDANKILDSKTTENITTLEEIKKSTTDQLDLFNKNIDDLENKSKEQENLITEIDTRVITLEDQMKTLKEQNEAVIDFAIAMNMESLLYKDALGNLDLGNGKLEAEEIIAGTFTVKVIDEESKTIGEVEILPIAKDEDNNGNDDYTQKPMDDPEVKARDGKSVEVLTKAITKTAKIFPASESNPGGYIWAEKIEGDKTDEYIGFRIRLSEQVDKKVRINWFIIETKEGDSLSDNL